MCITGDFNSRTGSESDFVEEVDNLPSRSNIDSTLNSYGDMFIDLCVDANFCMLNGRFDAEYHNFTCISQTGKSIEDYIIVQHDQLILFKDFKIITMNDNFTQLARLCATYVSRSFLLTV